MIPDEAVEAAYDKYRHLGLNASDIEGILETAAPHMLTRITNAVINRAYDDGRAAAAKPQMLALIWDAGERAGVDAMHGKIRPNPYRSQA